MLRRNGMQRPHKANRAGCYARTALRMTSPSCAAARSSLGAAVATARLCPPLLEHSRCAGTGGRSRCTPCATGVHASACAINDQHQLRCYIASRRQRGRPDQAAYEGCPDRLKLHDECYIHVFTYGRIHGGFLSIQFFNSDGSAASYGGWKQRMETPGTPLEMSHVLSDEFGLRQDSEASYCGMRVRMTTSGRIHSSSATICSVKDLPDQDDCKWLTLEPAPCATEF